MTKFWKSDGIEQEELEKLFRDKSVNGEMKPSIVQAKYPIFSGFSAAVFRKHWGTTKKMFDVDMQAYRNRATDFDDMSNSSIPELDGKGPPLKKKKLSLDGPSSNQTLPSTIYHRPPVIPCVYTDPETKLNKVLIVLYLHNGVGSIDFDLVESTDGPEPTLKVIYDWPSSMFDVGSMFKKGGEAEGEAAMTVPKMHTKVLAVEKALEKVRDHIEDTPVGHIFVKLPLLVQMDPDTWEQTFNKTGDGIIVFFEFQCIRTDYDIKKVEKTLQFNE